MRSVKTGQARENCVYVYFRSKDEVDMIQRAADLSATFRGNRSAFVVEAALQRAKKDIAKKK